MIRTFRAELVKLLRRRVLLVTAVVTAVFAAGSAAVVLASAGSAGRGGGRGVTLETLAAAGGGTEVFTAAIPFTGVFLFVVFTGAVAAEFSRGTVRTSLVAQPGRAALLAGRLGAQLVFAAGVLAAAELLTWGAAAVLAPLWDVATGEWLSVAGAGAALADYGMALAWVTGYALLGTALGTTIRSVSVALAVGVAWAGPFEHLLQDAWEPAGRLFPGLLLEAFVAGGTPAVSATRALLTVAALAAVATAGAVALFTRRDVTA